MNAEVNAQLSWISSEHGGRVHPPIGQRYTTVARYRHPKTHEVSFEWSVVVRFNELLNDVEPQQVMISFLSPEAPHTLLQPGFTLELYEGARLVAVCEVLQ
jgi:hypothetical protein